MTILTSILPVFITILAGYFIKKHFITSEKFWGEADRLIFYILIPIMLIHVLMGAPFNTSMLIYGGIIFGVITFIFILALILKPFIKTHNPGFSSVVQGSVRVNFFISLSIASLLYGQEGVAILSFALLFTVFSGVMYSIYSLQKFGTPPPEHIKQSASKRMIKNPVILSTLIGFGLSLIVDEIPLVVDKTMGIFDRAALPLALLSIGASLDLRYLGKQISPVLYSCVLGLFLSPLLGVVLCSYFELPLLLSICCVLMLGVPAAASSITFSARMGGDKELMSAILTTQTILGLLTVPLFISLTTYLHNNGGIQALLF